MGNCQLLGVIRLCLETGEFHPSTYLAVPGLLSGLSGSKGDPDSNIVARNQRIARTATG